MSRSNERVSRRDFLEATSLSAAGLLLGSAGGPVLGAGSGANGQVNVGHIGAGSQGSGLIRNLAQVPNAKIVAMCDIFPPNLKKGAELAGTQPKTFTDYRKVI